MSEFAGLMPQARPIAEAFVRVLRQAGLRVTVTSVRRSVEKQRVLWQACMRGQSRYPAAYPGTSSHELGVAFDMTVEPRAALELVGRLWERLGFRWGGRFADPIHFDFYRKGQSVPGDPRSCRPR